MKLYAQQLRKTFVAALLVFVGSMLAITAYSLWRLRAEAVSGGLDVSAMHSRGIENLVTQTLHVIELVTANTMVQSAGATGLQGIAATFDPVLSRAPFLRSISVLDEAGHIVASSNPANVGLKVSTEDFLPTPGGVAEILRIGKPWSGRDFSDGRPASPQLPFDADAPNFIPVAQRLVFDQHSITFLVALNSDYFINHITQQLGTEGASVDVLRYDGTLLMSTDSIRTPGVVYDYITRDLRLSEVEFGKYEEDSGGNQALLTAFRASRLYPLVVVTRINRDYALRHWQAEAKTLFSIVITVLLAIAMLTFAFYRRQMLLAAQRMESQRLQRINATVFDSSAVAILITDLSANIISINPAYTRVTDFHPDEVIGHHLYELLTAEGTVKFTEAMLKEQAAGLDDGAQSVSIEVQQRCKDGSLIWTEIHSTPERDAAGAITGYHRICRNVTGRKQMEDQIRQLAFYDPLTKLPNRRLLDDRLNQAMAASKRNKCYTALMFLDLDNFKPLNDQHGHVVGDLLLVEAAERLRSCVREMDTVARFGGDEFVVVLSALSPDRAESISQAASIANKIRTSLAAPYRLISRQDGAGDAVVEHCCTSSIGVVVFSDYQASPDEVLRWADAAMYEAKDSGRNAIRFYGSASFASEEERDVPG